MNELQNHVSIDRKAYLMHHTSYMEHFEGSCFVLFAEVYLKKKHIGAKIPCLRILVEFHHWKLPIWDVCDSLKFSPEPPSIYGRNLPMSSGKL